MHYVKQAQKSYTRLTLNNRNYDFVTKVNTSKITFEIFRQSFCESLNTKEDTKWIPCVTCRGTGKVRHIDDRDPIEGYKLAPWHTCQYCDGSGMGDKDYLTILYKKYKLELNQLAEDGQNTLNMVIGALDKLSNDEIELLKKFFDHGITSGFSATNDHKIVKRIKR